MKRANAERWGGLRAEADSRATAKAQQKTADAAATNATRLETARGLLIDRLNHALSHMPEDNGSRTRQTMKDERGRSVTRDYDLLALISVYEKLTRVGMGGEIDDDPVLAILRRWDDAAGE